MSTFSGRHGKGAMRIHREIKRQEAELRNAAAQAARYSCGHIHGRGKACANAEVTP